MGLDAAILGMVNQVLQKPTGTDWSLLTPHREEGWKGSMYIIAQTTTTVFSFSGSGFLTRFYIYARRRDTNTSSLTIQFLIDGTVMSELHTFTYPPDNLEAFWDNGPIWHFDNSLEIRVVNSNTVNLYLDEVKWIVEMSLE